MDIFAAPAPGLALGLILLAPFAGSFLAVLADRLPRGENWISARSRCRACDRPLGLADLVPVLSFLWLRGRCRRCGAAIPPWHLYAEIAAAGLALLAVLAAPLQPAVHPSAHLILTCICLWLLMALALSDALSMRLPDLLSGALLAAALARAAAQAPQALLPAAGTALAGAAAFLAIRLAYVRLRGREGLGLGDVKLMAGLGAFIGPNDLPLTVLVAALAGLAAALVLVLRRGRAAVSGQTPLPFGTLLCLAAVAVWLWQRAGPL